MTVRARRILLFPVMILLFVAPLGCISIPSTEFHPEVVDRAELDHAWSLFNAGMVDPARDTFRAYTSPGVDSRLVAEAYLGIGKCELIAGRSRKALPFLKQALPNLAGSGLSAACELALAEAYLDLGDLDLSRLRLERAFAYLSGDERDRAAGLLSLLYEAEGFTRQAERWKLLADDFVDHPDFMAMRRELIPDPEPVAEPKLTKSNARSFPSVVSRRQWGASAINSKRATQMGRITRITIHHTADGAPEAMKSIKDARKYLRRMQKHAREQKNWADIGYHFLIDDRGIVYEGRPLVYQGAHAGNRNLNKGNIGVALIGDFSNRRPTQKQTNALKRLVFSLKRRFGIASSRIQGHRHVRERAGESTTACPGPYVEELIPAL